MRGDFCFPTLFVRDLCNVFLAPKVSYSLFSEDTERFPHKSYLLRFFGQIEQSNCNCPIFKRLYIDPVIVVSFYASCLKS